ncbi:MAG TPA: phosphotransferase [Acidimicrobiales bacterium]|nr:phosphotransferase [Acidimicrobiales bacterium]
MHSRPSEVDDAAIHEALGRHWGLTVDRLDYLPEGGGAYHWVAASDTGPRWFVTCDDLDAKPWLGISRDVAFDGLVACYRTALHLATGARLPFAAAPVPGRDGALAVRLGPRFSLAVFPYIEGTTGRWGEPAETREREELVDMLAALHAATGAAPDAPVRPLAIPCRSQLEAALHDLAGPWAGGPHSEAVRRALADAVPVITTWLSEFDLLASRLAASETELVLTHGEPHPGNLIREAGSARLVLVDWDTVARGRPERDLWMLDDGTDTWWTRYTRITGRAVEPDAIKAHRSAWALTDLALFVTGLRAPHDDDADTARASANVRFILAGDEPAPYGRPASWRRG